MLICKDELKRILLMSKMKKRSFAQLQIDVETFEGDNSEESTTEVDESRTSSKEMVQLALTKINNDVEALENLFEDISMLLSAV